MVNIEEKLNKEQVEVLKNLKGVDNLGLLTRLGICESFYTDTVDYNDDSNLDNWVEYFKLSPSVLNQCCHTNLAIPKVTNDRLQPIVNDKYKIKLFAGNYAPDGNPMTNEEYTDMENCLEFFTYEATDDEIKKYLEFASNIKTVNKPECEVCGMNLVNIALGKDAQVYPSFGLYNTVMFKLLGILTPEEIYQKFKQVLIQQNLHIAIRSQYRTPETTDLIVGLTKWLYNANKLKMNGLVPSELLAPDELIANYKKSANTDTAKAGDNASASPLGAPAWVES